MIQGGDVVNFDGTSGESIYGPYFDDENFTLKHESAGLLSMVNEGRPHTNSSQFIIILESSPHLDNVNVVFGKVVRGMGAVLEMSKVKTDISLSDAPVEKISIIDCGEFKKGETWGLEENDGSKDVYTPWPEDWDYHLHVNKLTHTFMEDVIKNIKDSGNNYFEKENFVDASRKYKKALRYYLWMKQQNMSDTFYAKLAILRLDLLLNLAAVQLKQKNYQKTIELCNEVLETDKTKTKALYRRAQAYISLHEYKLGLTDLYRLSELYPKEKKEYIQQEILKVKEMENFYLKSEKTMCQRMFR